jgi:hypothetical protein
MKKNVLLFLLFALLLTACKTNSEKKLADVEKQELAKNIRHDSLFMGIYLGMPREAFLEHCWKKNKEGLFVEGSNKSVEYVFKKEDIDFKYPIQMNFYPRFRDDRIGELPVQFTFRTLDPWNPEMQTDKLLKEVRILMEKWYGNDFFLTTLPNGKKAYAKVHGNKRIVMCVEKDFEVLVVFTDLMATNY